MQNLVRILLASFTTLAFSLAFSGAALAVGQSKPPPVSYTPWCYGNATTGTTIEWLGGYDSSTGQHVKTVDTSVTYGVYNTQESYTMTIKYPNGKTQTCVATQTTLPPPNSPMILNNSFQYGDMSGWVYHDSTNGGNGTVSVQHCTPAAPGDSDGYCAVFTGIQTWGGQVLNNYTTAHEFQISACMNHSGLGSGSIHWGGVYYSSDDFDYIAGVWNCRSSVYENPTGSVSYLPTIFIYNNGGGTTQFDQFLFTVLKP